MGRSEAKARADEDDVKEDEYDISDESSFYGMRIERRENVSL